ncbi:HNH/ENDO VII superfamily nuclease with conserved GHE residues [Propionibacterium ruminifibrarum]|uniref:HNH/ENDO VII superfamily nuclease with conserved GHE residues n=1 Tax=Propionibacterium ruminifibrarum TaxID=1962131 RepID=A0A375I023_9ACTN|nr:GH-E family nuclease [Propionibacterium ruminifibrarum]SPF68127.1 HNH/ENDO VII superfamily nuclease with conserved GHE residues [Propionibacterium ruminifibrarum]
MAASMTMSMDGGGASGLVDPEMIPKIDTSYVTDAATELRNMSTAVGDNVDDIVTEWARLKSPGVYEAPESSTVYNLLDPASSSADGVETALSSAADALDDFADALDVIKPDLDAVREGVREFRKKALAGEDTTKTVVEYIPNSSLSQMKKQTIHADWFSAPERYSDENNHWIAKINDQVAKIINAENECANTINGLVSDDIEQLPTDITGAELDGQALPWGQRTEREASNCGQSVAMGIWDGVAGIVNGGLSFLSYNPRTGDLGDFSHAGQSVLGVGKLGLAFLLSCGFAGVSISYPLKVIGKEIGVDPLGKLAEENQVFAWYETMVAPLEDAFGGLFNIYPNSDKPLAAWRDDPVRAASSTVINVGSFFIPSADLGKAGAVGADVSRGARFTRYGARTAGIIADTILPGGSYVAKAAADIGVRGAGVASRASESLGVVARASTAVDNMLLHDLGKTHSVPDMGGVTSDLRGGGAGGVDAPSLGDGGPDLNGVGSSADHSVLPDTSHHNAPDLGGSESVSSAKTAHGGDDPSNQSGSGVESARSSSEVPQRAEAGNSVGANDAPETGAAKRAAVDNSAPEAGSSAPAPDATGGHGDAAGSSSSGSHGDGDVTARRSESSDSAGNGVDGDGESGSAERKHATETVPAKDAPRPYTADDVRQALEDAPRDKDGNPLDHRTGEPLLSEDSAGRRGWEMRWDPSSETWVAENRGNGYPNGLPPTGEPNSYGYDSNGTRMPYANSRPSYDPGDPANGIPSQEERVFEAARNEDGEVIVRDINNQERVVEWEPGEPHNDMDSGWDMGHKPGKEYAKMRDKYLNHEYSPDPIENERLFLEDYRNPDNYIPQDPLRNRSHMDEIP